MKRLFRFLLKVIIVLAVAFVIFLLYIAITDYRPEESEVVFQSENSTVYPGGDTITLMTWNVGVCGLGSEMDFFYDGGTMVRPTEEKTHYNLNAISKFVKEKEMVDFLLFQEVDLGSKRSYYVNHHDTLKDLLNQHKGFFAMNFDVPFIPIPITEPVGNVESGIMIFAKNEPVQAVRYSFPGNFSWPKSMFMLDRCFLLCRYKLNNGKELLIINTHNEAYDDGSLKIQQMNYLKKLLAEEFGKGNYIIVGGDWNQCPPDFTIDQKINSQRNYNLKNISKDFMPGWTWMYDENNPTVRMLDFPYTKGKTPTAVIDFFLLSPNISCISVKGINLEFESSDHNPVMVTVKLNK